MVLSAGGGNGNTALSSTELYDPATNTFAASASTPVMNTAHEFATATLLHNGKVLIAGDGFSTNLYALPIITVAHPYSTPANHTARVTTTPAPHRTGTAPVP